MIDHRGGSFDADASKTFALKTGERQRGIGQAAQRLASNLEAVKTARVAGRWRLDSRRPVLNPGKKIFDFLQQQESPPLLDPPSYRNRKLHRPRKTRHMVFGWKRSLFSPGLFFAILNSAFPAASTRWRYVCGGCNSAVSAPPSRALPDALLLGRLAGGRGHSIHAGILDQLAEVIVHMDDGKHHHSSPGVDSIHRLDRLHRILRG